MYERTNQYVLIGAEANHRMRGRKDSSRNGLKGQGHSVK